MISSNCDINEFLEAIGDKDCFDIILLANKEATEAERLAFHSGHKVGSNQGCGKEYVTDLRGLIFYLRYTVKPKALQKKFGQLSVKLLQDI